MRMYEVIYQGKMSYLETHENNVLLFLSGVSNALCSGESIFLLPKKIQDVHKYNTNNKKVTKVMPDLNFDFEKNLVANLCRGRGQGSNLQPRSGYV